MALCPHCVPTYRALPRGTEHRGVARRRPHCTPRIEGCRPQAAPAALPPLLPPAVPPRWPPQHGLPRRCLCALPAPPQSETVPRRTQGARVVALSVHEGQKPDRNTSKRWSEDNLLSPAQNKVLAHQRRLSPVRPPVTDEGRRPLQHVRLVTPVLPLVCPATPRPPPPQKTVTRSTQKLSGLINSWGAHL